MADTTTKTGALAHLDPALADALDRLPRQPGVYLLKDKEGTVVYVGKATSLHSRVRSYFVRSGDERAFVPLLSGLVGEVETLVTANVKEALLLENTLIKQHKPRFNVKLRDDKNYLVLRLDTRRDVPRLEVVRKVGDDGALYFGPYHSATACRQTLRLVNRHFQLRTCSDRALRTRKRPCIQHQIKRCLAPCVLEIPKEQYDQQVSDVALFLKGHGRELIQELEGRMLEASAELQFERAARIRDQIAALKTALMGQRVVGAAHDDQDVFGVYREGDAFEAVILLIRDGKLGGRRNFSFSNQEFSDESVVGDLVGRYYDRGEEVPRQVLLPLDLEDADAKAAWLADLRGGAVDLLVPKRGDRRKLVELAGKNARANFETRRKRDDDLEEALAKMQRRLRLARFPHRIECFDISGFLGSLVVASMVVMNDGLPDRSAYRRFKMSARSGDDFAAMYETLCRRFRRAKQGDAGWELPDLIVVDGGKAQLSMADAALHDVGLAPGTAVPDLLALAKERYDGEQETDAEQDRPDRVFRRGVKDPIRLRPNTPELFLLSQIRDEAHRFAITYHKALRRRKSLRSGLEDIPGIGPTRRKELLRTLGSLKRIRAASVDELTDVPSMSRKAAEAVVSYFTSTTGRQGD